MTKKIVKITDIVVKCQNEGCGKFFKSPVGFGEIDGFGDKETFESVKMTGNRTICPHCQKGTPLDKKFMKVTCDDGSVINPDL